jgi:PAS domain S-box-containing protein
VIYLARVVQPGAANAIQAGEAVPKPAQTPGLSLVVRDGLPTVDRPADDDDHLWMIGYAQVAEGAAGKPGEVRRELVSVEVDIVAGHRDAWLAAGVRAYLAVMILGLPFAAFLVVRRQREQREAIRNLSAAMEQSHSALMIVDLESRIEYANNGLCQQIGYSRRELIGRDWRDFRVAETSDDTLSELVVKVRSGKPWEGEWFNRRKSGEVYPVRGATARSPVSSRCSTT